MPYQGQILIPLGERQNTYDGYPPHRDRQSIPKAHPRDPSQVRRSPVHNLVPDLMVQWDLKAAWARDGMARAQTWRDSSATDDLRFPLQIQNTPYFQSLALPNEVKLLIPRNKERFAFSVANFTEGGNPIFWSYGVPPILEDGLIGGNPLDIGESHFEAGQNASIDAIYVFTRTANPTYVLGYEGIIAPEANKG